MGATSYETPCILSEIAREHYVPIEEDLNDLQKSSDYSYLIVVGRVLCFARFRRRKSGQANF